jgi:hypothetical protein
MSKWGVFAQEKIGDVVVDPVSNYIWLRDASPDAELEPDPDAVERGLAERTTPAENP